MGRGDSVYQDLSYILYFILTNMVIISIFVGLVLIIMLHYGYKSITIKFNKRNKLQKQIKKQQKRKEKQYLNSLEKRIK